MDKINFKDEWNQIKIITGVGCRFAKDEEEKEEILKEYTNKRIKCTVQEEKEIAYYEDGHFIIIFSISKEYMNELLKMNHLTKFRTPYYLEINDVSILKIDEIKEMKRMGDADTFGGDYSTKDPEKIKRCIENNNFKIAYEIMMEE